MPWNRRRERIGLGAAHDSTVQAYEDELEASFWDSLAESGLSRAEQRALAHALPLLKGRTLVVGCGTGRESLAVSKMGVSAVGIDLSRRLVAEARTHSPGPTGVAYVVGEATGLPFRDGSFDLVLMISQLLGHLPSRDLRRKALSEGGRLLGPDGILLASAYNRSFKDYPIPYLLWRALAGRSSRGVPSPPSPPLSPGEVPVPSASVPGLGGLKGIAVSMWRARALRARVAVRALRYRLSGKKGPGPRDFHVHPHVYRVSSVPGSGLSFYHIHTREEFIADARAAGFVVAAVFSVRELTTGAPLPSLLRDVDFIHYYLLRRAPAPGA